MYLEEEDTLAWMHVMMRYDLSRMRNQWLKKLLPQKRLKVGLRLSLLEGLNCKPNRDIMFLPVLSFHMQEISIADCMQRLKSTAWYGHVTLVLICATDGERTKRNSLCYSNTSMIIVASMQEAHSRKGFSKRAVFSWHQAGHYAGLPQEERQLWGVQAMSKMSPASKQSRSLQDLM